MRIVRNFLTILSLILVSGIAYAHPEDYPESESRPVTSVYRFEIGRTRVLSSYLSPLRYNGTSVALSGEWSKALPQHPESMVMGFEGSVYFSDMLNPPRTYRMYGMTGEFRYNLAWRHRFAGKWQVTTGGDIGFSGGALYLMHNSNNPVQALVSASIGIVGSASYIFNIGKIPLLVSDRVRIPSLGAFFSQDYGETYYEIYLGNHGGLAHCGWWGNNFGIDNLLSLKLDLGRTALELGYRYSLYSQWAHNLNTRISRHAFVIGVIPQGIGLKNKRKANFSIY